MRDDEREKRRTGYHDNHQTGARGEDQASKYLQQKGFRIVERNFRGKYGEIDIIAEKENTLHFIEVKTRKDNEYGEPLEAIRPQKLSHITRTAEWYVMVNHREDCYMSIDGIGIKEDGIEFIEGINM